MQYATDKARTITFRADETVPLKKTSLTRPLRKIIHSQMHISSLFQMQERVLSHALNISSKRLVGDVIICAPTGSGKTLAYALPIVQDLMRRKVPRLRAVVVVPTRDLAMQVSKVFVQLTSNLGISVVVISGASSIATEAKQLKLAEILIATPGRLVDHIVNDNCFSLRSVRYLVLDESDRLLQESYQGWIESVLPLLGRQHSIANGASTEHPSSRQGMISGLLAIAIQPDVSARSFTRVADTSEEVVRKILVSATQTRNPKRLVRLGLRQPTFFELQPANTEDRSGLAFGYAVPSTMTERGWVVPDIKDKPTALLKMLGWAQSDQSLQTCSGNEMILPQGGVKLIFTKSVESAHRLCRLLELSAYRLGIPGDILEMSGELSPKRRGEVLRAIQSSTVTDSHGSRSLTVVSSDVLARGMDMINVDAVINYDAPVHIRTYLHRAGRTARAGRSGVVWTLVLAKQAHHFREMVRQAERGAQKVRVKNMNIPAKEQSMLFVDLTLALSFLSRIIAREKLGLLPTDESLPRYALNELWKQAASVTDASEEPKSSDDHNDIEGHDEGEQENRVPKRRKTESTQVSTGLVDTGLSALEGNAEDTPADDRFRDILFAQIARNLAAV